MASKPRITSCVWKLDAAVDVMAVGVMDDEPFPRAEQFVGNHERADGIVAGRSSGVADDIGVALDETGEFSGSRRASMQLRLAKCRGRHGKIALSCRSLNPTAGWL